MNPHDLVNSILQKTLVPDLLLSAQDMGLKSTITLDKKYITLNLCAGFPCGLLQDTWLPLLTKNLSSALPDYDITIHLDSLIKSHRTQMAGKGLRSVKNTIAIASGKGGVGKSTVTVNLAAALVKAGARVGILDADIYGPSIPTMLGKTDPIQLEGERYLPILAHGIQAMSIGYLVHDDSALIWRGPMLAKALIQMLDTTQWDELDYLFIDLPPGTGDIQLSLVQKIPLTAAIIVTTPQTVATLDAQKALKMFETTHIHVLGVIENMSIHTCSQCGQRESIFGQGGAQQLCEQHQTQLLGQLPLDSRITTQSDLGTPTAISASTDLVQSMTEIAYRTAIELSKRPLNYTDKFPPIIVE